MNERIMEQNVDELRTLLRERANFAPDPDVVLLAVREVALRRRKWRRTTGLVGVVGLTTAVLVAAGVFGHLGSLDSHSVRTATDPALRTAPQPLTAPRLPVTVGGLPAGFVVESWNIRGTDVDVQYRNPAHNPQIDVGTQETDPSIGEAQLRPTTVNGVPAVFGTPTSEHGYRRLSWQFRPGKWVSVGADLVWINERTLRTVAESVTDTPTTLPFPLRVSAVPAGWVPRSWSEGMGFSDVVLCPAGVTYSNSAEAADQKSLPGCVYIDAQPETASNTVGEVSPDGHGSMEVPLRPVPGDHTGVSATPDGRIAVRQVDPNHRIRVGGTNVDPAIVRDLAEATTLA